MWMYVDVCGCMCIHVGLSIDYRESDSRQACMLCAGEVADRFVVLGCFMDADLR